MNSIAIISSIFAFGLGYVLGRLDGLFRSLSLQKNDQDVSIFSRPKQKEKKKIVIDDTKFVTSISTDDLSGGSTELGVVTQTTDDISSAASKLAQLKKMKG